MNNHTYKSLLSSVINQSSGLPDRVKFVIRSKDYGSESEKPYAGRIQINRARSADYEKNMDIFRISEELVNRLETAKRKKK